VGRHETPVLAKSIEIIHMYEDMIVVDKPCAIPVGANVALHTSLHLPIPPFLMYFAVGLVKSVMSYVIMELLSFCE
jgi:hypothetical protein